MDLKETMRGFVEELKGEMQSQHEQTREEVRSAKGDIMSALKSSPVQFIELQCKFGIVILLFSLLVRIVLSIELINTAFAIFMLFALAVYWAMARLKHRSQERRG